MDDDERRSNQSNNWSSFLRNRSASMSTFASLTGTMPPLQRDSETTTTTAAPAPSAKSPEAESVDLRQLDLVSPCDDNLICSICHGPFVKPVKLSCEHIFCEECVKQTWEMTQVGRTRTCPHCRSRVGNVFTRGDINKIVLAMLDELKVRCPKQAEGCTAEVARAEVQDHVDKYCGWTEISCPSLDCEEKLQRKDVEGGCTHFDVTCEDCGSQVWQRDLVIHQEKHCLKSTMTCSECDAEILRRDMKSHVEDECLEAIQPCSGSSYGCKLEAKRPERESHSLNCPFVSLAPYLEAQRSRQDELETTNKTLQRKLDILEGGFASMQELLYSTPTVPTPHETGQDLDQAAQDASNPAIDTRMDTHLEQHFDPDASPLMNQRFDSLAQSIESLRHEVRMSVRDLDSRYSMLEANRELRSRDELAHTNAAINAMRMQLQRLVTEQMQQRHMLQQHGIIGSGTVSSAGPGVVRRLSDSSRQETKL
ncbi:MAG: hypothetical protein M1820_001162 [Bogoriella megaspora]|nr:MAG: hypothetical protein M1820_001162 [Bogoriella megaspora]